jgi:phenylpyruvate tautomerase PptA (4-oxalocrotonate tautomerase family)
MPMIDVYAEAGTFSDPAALATRLAATLMEVERVPDISLFRKNTAAFVHESTVSNVEGDNNYVRVQVLTNAGALNRAKQLDAVSRLTAAVAEAAGDPTVADRTWVQLTETYDGGWGLAGHANTNDELVALARAELTGS